VNRCPKCGHRADLPPASCDCDRCDGLRAQAAASSPDPDDFNGTHR